MERKELNDPGKKGQRQENIPLREGILKLGDRRKGKRGVKTLRKKKHK